MNIGTFLGSCPSGSGSGGGGTVTSITEDVNLFPEVLVNGVASFTITGSGTFAWSKVTQLPNTFWAGPINGAPAVPTFRTLNVVDGEAVFWTLTGNAGTSAGPHYIGTNDAQDWIIKTNVLEAVRVVQPALGKSGRVGIGTVGGTPSAQLEVYRENNVVAATVPDLWSFRTTNVMNKWQTVPYIANSCFVGWYADPAGYAPPPTSTYGGGFDFSFNIATQGDPTGYPTPAGQYFEYAGIGINLNYTSEPGGNATQVSDGQSGGYVYDGHINKPWFVIVPSSGAFKQQVAGNVKLMELGMHNAVPPYRAGNPYTVSTGIQMNLSDKLVAGQPTTGVYDYVRCVPGSPTVTGVGTLPPIRSTVLLNGVPYVVLNAVGTTVTLTTNYAGGMTSVAGVESVHYAYEVGAIVTATNGSTAVSRSSGLNFDTAWVGYQVMLGGTIYYIASVTDANNLVLTGVFGGTTGTTNANFYSIYVAHQDIAFHAQTHSDDRNWNAILQHNHGFATPCNDQDNVRTLISGDGGLFNRFAYIAPYKTTWSPGANWGSNSPINVGSAFYLTEEFTAEMAGALMTAYSPVKVAQPMLYFRQDTSTYTGNLIQGQMATNGAGAASGGFTGNYFAFYKKGGSATELKIWGEHNGTLRGRFLDIGPRADADGVPAGGAVNISDAHYTAMAGNMLSVVQAAAGGRAGIYQRNDTAAYTGSFFKVSAGTDSVGAPSGTFTGMVLDYQYPQGTQKAFLDYSPQLCMAAIAAPAAYGATFGQLYFDTADQKWHVVDGAGNHAL